MACHFEGGIGLPKLVISFSLILVQLIELGGKIKHNNSTIKNLSKNLSDRNLQGNGFDGSIPTTIASLLQLQEL